MTIDVLVLLVGILTWGVVQLSALAFTTKYMNKFMALMEKVTDAALKMFEKIEG